MQQGISQAGFLKNWHTLDHTLDNIDESDSVDAVKLVVAVLKKIDAG